MKLKLNENGFAEVVDGKPVYIHDNGDEVPFDALQANARIKTISDEAKGHRLNLKEVTQQFEEFKQKYGELDLEEALKAINTVKALDQKDLVKASEVERLKEMAAAGFNEEKTKMINGHTAKVNELTQQYESAVNTIRQMKLKEAFATSEWFGGENAKTTYAPWEAYEIFGKFFKIEGDGMDAQPVAYLNGEKVLSRENYVDSARFDEAIGQIIASNPNQFNKILSTNGGGGGGKGNQETGGGKFVAKGDNNAFIKNLADIASGKVKVKMA